MYEYQKERPRVLTDEGQRALVTLLKRVQVLCAKSGYVRLNEAVAGIHSDSWVCLALMDRLVEMGEVRELVPARDDLPQQFRCFYLVEA